jgi:hypothetical protein
VRSQQEADQLASDQYGCTDEVIAKEEIGAGTKFYRWSLRQPFRQGTKYPDHSDRQHGHAEKRSKPKGARRFHFD